MSASQDIEIRRQTEAAQKATGKFWCVDRGHEADMSTLVMYRGRKYCTTCFKRAKERAKK